MGRTGAEERVDDDVAAIGEVEEGVLDMWQTATLETEIAARDFRHDAPGIALGIRGSSTETGPWRGKLLKCRGILWRRKSRRFTRASWWWTQSHETSLPRLISLLAGKFSDFG